MKSRWSVILISIVVFLSSCEKEPLTRLGFNTSIDKYSNGLLIVQISNETKRFYLTGVISLSDGQAAVSLINPDGISVYSNTVVAPVEMRVNETINGIPGFWKLKYESNNGEGKINLHILK